MQSPTPVRSGFGSVWFSHCQSSWSRVPASMDAVTVLIAVLLLALLAVAVAILRVLQCLVESQGKSSGQLRLKMDKLLRLQQSQLEAMQSLGQSSGSRDGSTEISRKLTVMCETLEDYVVRSAEWFEQWGEARDAVTQWMQTSARSLSEIETTNQISWTPMRGPTRAHFLVAP